MNETEYIDTFINSLKSIREEQFKKVEFTYEDIILPVKRLHEKPEDYVKFTTKLKKDGKIQKMKPGNINKKSYEPENADIDILKDDIFNEKGDENGAGEEIHKLDIEKMTRDEKIECINQFLSRKNILLEKTELEKIEKIVDNPEIPLKKYLSISKIYQQITKITFIKKMENGFYYVSLEESKAKKKTYFH
jgi:hypothetical protein